MAKFKGSLQGGVGQFKVYRTAPMTYKVMDKVTGRDCGTFPNLSQAYREAGWLHRSKDAEVIPFI